MGVLFARGMRRQHARDIPPTPTNAERVRAYRALAPVELGNGRQWAWHAAQYAREAVPGSEGEYAQQLADGFRLKYGE